MIICESKLQHFAISKHFCSKIPTKTINFGDNLYFVLPCQSLGINCFSKNRPSPSKSRNGTTPFLKKKYYITRRKSMYRWKGSSFQSDEVTALRRSHMGVTAGSVGRTSGEPPIPSSQHRPVLLPLLHPCGQR